MENNLPSIDSIVVFRNSQGLVGRGTLVHITRRVVVFEVYNPYSPRWGIPGPTVPACSPGGVFKQRLNALSTIGR
jgi:hypothetical protein